MALTTSEEAIVKQLIVAFQNGKRLSDLTEVKSTNPFNFLVEVLDLSDNESKKAKLSSMLPYLEEECAYGVEFDTSVSSPTCTRVGNMSLHKSLPVQSQIKGCLLDDSGEVVSYLNPVSWIGYIRDGSRGMVMDELPFYYRRFITNGTKRRVMLSEYPLPGYHAVQKKYVSAYEATVDRSVSATPKLASVVNLTASFRGGNNNADWDGTYRSLLGMPATQISRTNFRAYARNRNSGDTQWNCNTYDIQKDLYWLFVVEYATLNSQAAYNAELTSEGYHQGGLGAGVTTLDGTKWNNFNGYYPFIPCGYTDELGNGTGVKDFTMPTEYDSSATKVVSVPRYRGIENPFGHLWKWTDGINDEINAGDDGLSRVFVCNDPSKFNDSNYTGYHHIGNEARKEGYVKTIIFGEEGDIMPSEVGGSSSTYFCDYHYTNIPTSTTLRGVLFGGDAISGAVAGLVSAGSDIVPSYTFASIGSRLCYIPKAA